VVDGPVGRIDAGAGILVRYAAPFAPITSKGKTMSTRSAANSHEQSKVWKMLESIDICMFITQGAGGWRGRPMSTIPKADKSVIYLLTEAESGAAQDLAGNGAVLMSYQSSSDHVAVTGQAKVIDDKALVKSLWSPGAQVFWPEGPKASDVVVIAVTPDQADYWDGPNPVVGAVKFMFSLATGREPNFGEQGAVRL
jgi:general stress protein 26